MVQAILAGLLRWMKSDLHFCFKKRNCCDFKERGGEMLVNQSLCVEEGEEGEEEVVCLCLFVCDVFHGAGDDDMVVE